MTMRRPSVEGLTRARLDREEGYRLLGLLQDESYQRSLLPGLEEIVPGFPDWLVTALFGGTYLREGLSLRDRQLVNLAALTAVGGVDPQLAGHVRTSLRVGMNRQEILEVFVHLAPYIGVPRALAGLRVAVAAFADTETDTETDADADTETDAETDAETDTDTEREGEGGR
ncbi:carboxymuconolactone decarboxylase family protein [Microbispora sp. CSR-4]|uniref:carboxymuconolactone decarboxylase family protein n=1 Tax=Microbispora sp. CSR-4 TaxID=2592813 RepID=UPI001C9C4649|nr:carboxymuconolactone decarboxylase family protein [Microbispora sp. CSR-4]